MRTLDFGRTPETDTRRRPTAQAPTNHPVRRLSSLLHPCWLVRPSECPSAVSPQFNELEQLLNICTPALRQVRAKPRATARYVPTRKAHCSHLCSTDFCIQPLVLFETHGQVRKYILNRPKKLNALDTQTIDTLRPFVEVCRSLALTQPICVFNLPCRTGASRP